MKLNNWYKAEKVLKNSGIVIAPTDTLYGILAKADNKKVVEKVYIIKGRDENKPFIILITSFDDFKKFDIKLTSNQKEFLDKIWPGKVSVIMPCNQNKFNYLHRGHNNIAFRMIGKRNKNLFNLIQKVGPVIAPSANPQGLNPALNIIEAKKYFDENIDLYVSGGIRKSKASTLIELKDGKFNVLRNGAVKIKKTSM